MCEPSDDEVTDVWTVVASSKGCPVPPATLTESVTQVITTLPVRYTERSTGDGTVVITTLSRTFPSHVMVVSSLCPPKTINVFRRV